MPKFAAVVAAWSLLVLHPVAAPHSVGGKSSPQMTITASPSSIIGLQIFANVNLFFSGSVPSGSITFQLFAPGDTSCASPAFTSTVPVTGQSMNSAHYTTTRAGTYQWTASYSGDANDNPFGPTACSDPDGSVGVQGASTAVSLSAPAPAGGTIHGVATLGGGYSPTGSITFSLSAPGDTFCSHPIFTSTVPVQGNGTYSSGNYTPSVTGTYSWQAGYSGDADNETTPITACLNQSNTVAVTSVSPPPPAEGTFAYPTNGQSGVDTTEPFSWTTTATAQGYILVIGTKQFGTDLVNSGILPATTSSLSVPALPVGVELYATLLTETSGSWTKFQAITFTAEQGFATFVNPVGGQAHVGPAPTFRWTTIPQGQAYYLVVGTTKFGTDIVNSGVLRPAQASYTASSLPSGRTLYATLLTETDGTWARFQAITFTT